MRQQRGNLKALVSARLDRKMVWGRRMDRKEAFLKYVCFAVGCHDEAGGRATHALGVGRTVLRSPALLEK